MTISPHEIAHQDTENATAFAAGLVASEPVGLDDETRFYSVVTPEGAQHHVVDLEALREKFAPTPRRKTGTYNVHTALSFCDFVAKHEDGAEVWADEARQKLVGILNANLGGDNPRWEDHQVHMELVHTPAWTAWIEHNNRLLSQEVFAELIEARTIDIVDPSAADMLEIAETFHATTGVEFKSSKILASGERQLAYIESTTASAGSNKELTIPKQFQLGIAPYVGSAPRLITARFRYRINGGHLQLGYVLERPEDVLQDAFTELVTAVSTNLPEDVPVFYGRPAK